MKEFTGNIWDFHDKGNWVAVTTNGTVTKRGESVMGRGVAYQAKVKFPSLPHDLGGWIKSSGNHVYPMPKYRIFSFPTKHDWWEQSDIELIENSCNEIVEWLDVLAVKYKDQYPYSDLTKVHVIYMTKAGCGAGGLKWNDVKPVMKDILDDRFIVVDREFVRGVIRYDDPVKGTHGEVAVNKRGIPYGR